MTNRFAQLLILALLILASNIFSYTVGVRKGYGLRNDYKTQVIMYILGEK